MIHKNWIIKKRMKGQIFYEVGFPIIWGLLMNWLFSSMARSPDNIAFFFLLIMANIFAIPARFIMTNMVQDKQTKMRETLRIMSLERVPYSLSYFILQAI